MSEPNPLRVYRLEAELTLEEFGVLFGVNKSTVMRWESGQVPAERAIEIEKITGVPRQLLRPDLYGTVSRSAKSRAVAS